MWPYNDLFAPDDQGGPLFVQYQSTNSSQQPPVGPISVQLMKTEWYI